MNRKCGWILGFLCLACACSYAQDRLPNPFEPLPIAPADATQPPQSSEPPRAIDPAQDQLADDTGIEPPNAAGDAQGNANNVNGAKAAAGVKPIFITPDRKNLLTGEFKKPYLIEIDLQIDELFAWYLLRSLDNAKAAGADLVIIRLKTPGGLLHTSMELANHLLDIDWAKIVVWIPEEAISGGAIVSLGADAIYMKPNATIGDVGILHLKWWGAGVLAEEKDVSYHAEMLRQVAQRSGRPPELAAAMMDRKLVVFEGAHKATNKTVFLTKSQSEDPGIQAQVTVGKQLEETGIDRFLTVGGKRAQQLELCEALFETETAMIQQLTNVEPVRIQINWREKLAFSLSGPWLSALIIIAGLVCLYLEFTIPGATLPGLISMCCFAVFFWSHLLYGTAGGLEIMMFLLGTACLAIEIFVLPGFGIFGIAGLLMIGLSLLLATQDFLIPHTAQQWKLFEQNGLSIFVAGIVVVGLIAFQLFYLDSIPGLKRFQLSPEPMPPATQAAVETHPAASLSTGMFGSAHSDLRPSGKAIIEDEVVDVVSDGDYIERGSKVKVVRIEGNIVTVRKCIG